MIVCQECVESRTVRTGQVVSAELHYDIFDVAGTVEHDAALAILIATAPSLFDPWGSGLLFIPRVDQEVKEDRGANLWRGTVSYRELDVEYTFDTTGGIQHITHALAHVASYAPSGKTAPNHNGAIGWDGQTVQGVDIPVPVANFTETHPLSSAYVNAYRWIPWLGRNGTYKDIIWSLTGAANLYAYKSYDVGECLFMGATGGKRGTGDYQITYRFSGMPTVVNRQIGDITGITKRGWDYLWVEYQQSSDETAFALVPKPIAVHVDQVVPLMDLSWLGV